MQPEPVHLPTGIVSESPLLVVTTVCAETSASVKAIESSTVTVTGSPQLNVPLLRLTSDSTLHEGNL